MTDDVWREFFDSYAPQYMNEVFTLCPTAGFALGHVWGGTAGDWGRRPVEPNEIEIMAVMGRPAA